MFPNHSFPILEPSIFVCVIQTPVEASHISNFETSLVKRKKRRIIKGCSCPAHKGKQELLNWRKQNIFGELTISFL